MVRKRPRRQLRIRADDLAGIEDAARVEDRLELPKNGKQRPILPGHPRRPRQAGAVLRADGAAKLQGQRVDGLGNGGQAADVFGPIQIQKRPGVDLAGTGMDQE